MPRRGEPTGIGAYEALLAEALNAYMNKSGLLNLIYLEFHGL